MNEHPRTEERPTSVRDEVVEIVSRISRIDPEEFEEDVRIREELGIDSLMAMEIVAACEKAFGISIDEGQLFCVETVGDFLDLVESLHLQKDGSA
jgi:acyl carrier protein